MQPTLLHLLSRASLLFLGIHRTHRVVAATTYHVTHTGRRTPTTVFSKTVKMYSLSGALRWARAGDTVLLADGTYTIRVDSRADGMMGSPITITGGKNAIIKADTPAVRIQHSWITLQARWRCYRLYLVNLCHTGACEIDGHCRMTFGTALAACAYVLL